VKLVKAVRKSPDILLNNVGEHVQSAIGSSKVKKVVQAIKGVEAEWSVGEFLSVLPDDEVMWDESITAQLAAFLSDHVKAGLRPQDIVHLIHGHRLSKLAAARR
jgi:hypothetical protein